MDTRFTSALLALGLLPAVSFAAPAQPTATLVLAENFGSGRASALWSDTKVTAVPNGKGHYLGPFGTGTVSLVAQRLPTHQALRLAFKLHLLGSWDGVGLWGPDRWRCGLRGGPVCLETTFNNCFLVWSDNIWQSYPELYNPVQQSLFARLPRRPSHLLACHGGTGAARIADLGFAWSKHPNISTTYDLAFVIPHTATEATLEFTNLCDDPLSDQSYALGEVRLETLDRVPPWSAEEAERAWQLLFCGSSSDAAKAEAQFLTHPQELRCHAQQLVEGETGRIKALMACLDTGAVRAEGLYTDVDAGEDQDRLAALRELTLMPGDLWKLRQQHDPFDAEHPQQCRNLQSWIYVMYGMKDLSTPPLVRAGMRLSSLLRQQGTPADALLADQIEARVSSKGETPKAEVE